MSSSIYLFSTWILEDLIHSFNKLKGDDLSCTRCLTLQSNHADIALF